MEKYFGKIIDLNSIFNNIFYTPTLCSFVAKIMALFFKSSRHLIYKIEKQNSAKT